MIATMDHAYNCANLKKETAHMYTKVLTDVFDIWPD